MAPTARRRIEQPNTGANGLDVALSPHYYPPRNTFQLSQMSQLTTHEEWLKLLRRLTGAHGRTTWKPAKVCSQYGHMLDALIEQLPAAQACMANGWRAFVVGQTRGRCYYQHRVLTIPSWLYTQPRKDPQHPLQYLSHEVAHAYTPGGKHGGAFMRAYMEICPVHLQYLEHSYKPRNAAAAGVPTTSDARPQHLGLLSQRLPSTFTAPVRPIRPKLAGTTLSADAVLDALKAWGGMATIAVIADERGWQPLRVHGAFLALKARGVISYSNKTATIL